MCGASGGGDCLESGVESSEGDDVSFHEPLADVLRETFGEG